MFTFSWLRSVPMDPFFTEWDDAFIVINLANVVSEDFTIFNYNVTVILPWQ